MFQCRAVTVCRVAGYLGNIWKLDDLIVLVHCPESPKLPTLSLKSTVYDYFITLSKLFLRSHVKGLGGGGR